MYQLFYLDGHFPAHHPWLKLASVGRSMELGIWGDRHLREDTVAIGLLRDMIYTGLVLHRGRCRRAALDHSPHDRGQGHHPEDEALGAVDVEVQATVATTVAVTGARAETGAEAAADIEGLGKLF